MDLKLPMVVVHRGRRLVEAWVPGIPSARKIGPSLSEIRDDLALAVMERFEQGPPESLGQFQLPPHVALKLVTIDTVAHDKARNRRLTLKGRIGVLVEKWPDDDFHVVTPTRLVSARFALSGMLDLDDAVARRIAAYCVEHEIESLESLHAEQRERLDILEVDADPPTIFPTGTRHRRRARRAKRDRQTTDETPGEREERRRARRLQVRTLRSIARNLTHAAMDDTLDRAFGREAIVREVLDAIDGREGVAIVLVGAPGAGKTAIVHEVVRRLTARQNAANTRRDVWRIDGQRFIAGMSFVGQWEARARELIDELRELGDVAHLDDLLSIVMAGRTRKGSANLAQFLEPHLSRNELTVVAESTPERFDRVREESPTFAAQFRVVHVPPLDDRATLPVLLGVMRNLEGDESALGVRVVPEALEAVLQLSRRFMAHEAFPGKAVRLLRTAAGDGPGPRLVQRSHVVEAVRRQTGLPTFVLGIEQPRPRESIRASLAAMVAGQPEAIDAVTDVVITLQHSLGDPEKPLATFLFVGPTGVGKTETAKALARFLFGSASRLVRFDMSEFQSTASVSRLVGQPEARDGELTLALRTQPFSVILFDEVEKAHPRVFDALLQLLGEGRLTDAAGRTADARQSVIIMTSNLGVREAVDRTGFVRDDSDESRKHYISSVRAFFRPEFFNRIDRVIPFASLDRDALRVVVEYALADLLGRRGVQRSNVLVDVEPELLDLLVTQAYDPRYGARPLRRALERRLAVPLAHHLVRRQSTDLALVQLFRRGDEMALTVHALRDDPQVDGLDDPTAWTGREVFDAFGAVQRRLDQLRASDEFARLEDLRSAALRDVATATRDSAVIELLERIETFSERVRELEDGDLAEVHYELREVREGYDTDSRDPGKSARKGLRPRVGVMDIQLDSNLDAVAHRARSTVAGLRDQLEILAHQMRAGATRGVDALTVVVEPVTPGHPEPLAMVARMFALPFARVHWLAETSVDNRKTWVDVGKTTIEKVRRYALGLEGFGLREIIGQLVGHHVAASLGVGTTVLIESSPCDGSGIDVLDARDRARATERDRRRRGETDADNVGAPERVVSRQTASGHVHLATVLGAHAHEAIAAALLRALRRGWEEP